MRALAPRLEGLRSLERVVQLSGGVSRETWSLDAVTATGTIPLILRRQPAGVAADQDLNLPQALEAEVVRCAASRGIPAPRVLAVLAPSAGVGEGYVMERVAGETLAPRILSDERFASARARMLGDCAKALADVHCIRSEALPAIPTFFAAHLLTAYERMYRSLPATRAALEYGFRWLEAHLPEASEAALVHGDFRLGNLVVTERGLASVLDWELAHFGDPMEDLGWFCTNAWRFGRPDHAAGGFGSREELYAAYETAGGRRVDRERARYWEIFGCLKWAVITMRFAQRHLSRAQLSVELLAIGRRTAEAEMDLLNLVLA